MHVDLLRLCENLNGNMKKIIGCYWLTNKIDYNVRLEYITYNQLVSIKFSRQHASNKIILKVISKCTSKLLNCSLFGQLEVYFCFEENPIR